MDEKSVVQDLVVSREKSLKVLDAAIAQLRAMAEKASPAGSKAFRQQVVVKEQRRKLVAAELEAFRFELAQLEAQQELPGTSPRSEPPAAPPVLGKRR